MTADLLRQAAALMRERATAAAATGAWDWRSTEGHTWWSATRSGRYIQSWHPDATFAVAYWLMDVAARITMSRDLSTEDEIEQALAVARAYLDTPT